MFSHPPLLVVNVSCPGRSSSYVLAGFRCLSRSQPKNDNTSRQEYLSLISVWSSNPTIPLFFFGKHASIGAPHPSLPNHLQYTATDWRFFIVVISWTKVFSILLGKWSQDFCTGYVMHRTAVRELAKFACGLPQIPVLKPNRPKRPRHIFLLTGRAWD